MDRRTSAGAWTSRVLDLIGRHRGRRAADLAALIDWSTPDFKARVRRLKALGLTESLEVGYGLSPRGRSYLVKSRRGTST
jgi:DNA-binding MarR family transcriptional regulator